MMNPQDFQSNRKQLFESIENPILDTFKSSNMMNVQTYDRIFENYDYFDDLLQHSKKFKFIPLNPTQNKLD